MRAIKWAVAALLVITVALYAGNGAWERISGQKEGPRITCSEELLEISVHAPEEALLEGVTAEDAQDGDLTGNVIVGGVSRLTGGDTADVTYLVFDSDNNMASCVRQVRYTDYHRSVIGLTGPIEAPSQQEAELLSRVTVTDAVDGDLSRQAVVSSLWPTEDPNVFSATVMVTNSMGDIATVEVPVFIRNSPSSVQLRQQILYLEQGAEFDPADQLASSRAGISIRSEVDTQQPGCYWVWYTDGRNGDQAILSVVVE